MQTCKTCKWWGIDASGCCGFVDTLHAVADAGTMIRMDVTALDDSGLEVDLRTGPEFGCIHHTPHDPGEAAQHRAVRLQEQNPGMTDSEAIALATQPPMLSLDDLADLLRWADTGNIRERVVGSVVRILEDWFPGHSLTGFKNRTRSSFRPESGTNAEWDRGLYTD